MKEITKPQRNILPLSFYKNSKIIKIITDLNTMFNFQLLFYCYYLFLTKKHTNKQGNDYCKREEVFQCGVVGQSDDWGKELGVLLDLWQCYIF